MERFSTFFKSTKHMWTSWVNSHEPWSTWWRTRSLSNVPRRGQSLHCSSWIYRPLQFPGKDLPAETEKCDPLQLVHTLRSPFWKTGTIVTVRQSNPAKGGYRTMSALHSRSHQLWMIQSSNPIQYQLQITKKQKTGKGCFRVHRNLNCFPKTFNRINL